MKSKFREKALSLITSLTLIVNSISPFFTFARPVISTEPLKADINFKTSENTFDISANTTNEVEYSLYWKSQDGLQGIAKTKVNAGEQDFQRDIYAGIKSGPDARQDIVVRGIYKVEVKSQSWITAIKFALDDGRLKEEGKKEYLPQDLDLSDEETKWIEDGDPVPTPTTTETPAPTVAPTVEVTLTPTIEPQGEVLGGGEVQKFMTPDVDGTVETKVVETYSCRADSINGCLITDKADYSPTEVVLISGYGFAPNTTYSLKISSQDEPAVTYEAQIATDKDGAFTASYQLDGNYRPNYLTELYDQNGIVVASVTFTDTDYQPDYKHWADKSPASWQNGALQSSNSRYFEGEVVPHYWQVQSLTNGSNYGFNIYYDYFMNQSGSNYCGFDYLAQYNTSRTTTFYSGSPSADNGLPEGHGNFYTVGANITSVAMPVTTGNQRYVQVKFTATASTAVFYWGLHLATPGSISGCLGSRSWPGASLQTNVSDNPNIPSATDLGGGGTKQINPSGIIRGIISGYKWNDLNSNGNFDAAEPKLSGWTIRLCSDSSCANVLQTTTTDASGNYTFSVTPGTYYVSEVQQSGWTKTSPTSSSYGPLTVTATSYSFTNRNFGNHQLPVTGTLSIHKKNLAGLPMSGVSFSISGPTSSTASTDANGDVSFSNIPTGDYTVTETEPSGFHWVSTSGDCSDANPSSVTVTSSGQSCTFTNAANTGKIELKKHFEGTAQPIDLKIGTTQGGQEVNKTSLVADGTTGEFTVDEGDYYLSEQLLIPSAFTTGLACFNDANHNDTIDPGETSHSVNDATGKTTIGLNDDVICLFTNTRNQGTIELKKQWVGGAGNVTIKIGSEPGAADIDTQDLTGEDGTTGQNLVNIGTYYLSETLLPGYDTSLSCFDDQNNNGSNDEEPAVTVGTSNSIDVQKDQHVVCTFTNTKLPTLTINKVCEPGTDEGRFNLNVDGTTVAADAACGATETVNVSTGRHVVSETAGTGTNLDNYISKITGDCAEDGSITLDAGQNKECTITNSRPFKFIVEKVICDDKDFLPHWGGGNTVTADTAQDWVDGSEGHCSITTDWTFQWSDNSPSQWDSDLYPAPWQSFTAGQEVEIRDITQTINVREVIPADSDYVGFSSGDDGARMVCSNNSNTNDNWEEVVDKAYGKTAYCVAFNGLNKGTISGTKYEDVNGDGKMADDESEPGINNWEIVLKDDEGNVLNNTFTGSNGTYTFASLLPGDYSICEVGQTGWTQTSTPECIPVTLNGNDQTGIDFGNFHLAQVGGRKFEDVNNNHEFNDGESYLNDWTIRVYKDNNDGGWDEIESLVTGHTEEDGQYEVKGLAIGNYRICEVSKTGWFQTYPVVEGSNNVAQDEAPACYDFAVNSSGMTDTNMDFGNVHLGNIKVIKYHDLDRDGVKDENEPILSGWDMTLGNDTKSTDENGEALFENLVSGGYVLSENIKEDWLQTNINCGEEQATDNDNSHPVNVVPGETVNCYVGNYHTPILNLSKYNDGSSKTPGGKVVYKLVLKILNNKMFGVKIKDLLPKGFRFSSILSSTLNGENIILPDPNYHSPGTYNLGDLNEGSEVIIEYEVDIDGGQEFGLYKDLAWAAGNDATNTKILALSQDGYVDQNFVGTAVKVDGNLTESGNAQIAESGQVLGAATSRVLPATGANAIWLTIASILIGLGLSIMLVWFIIKEKKLKTIMKKLVVILAFALSIFVTSQVNASDISVRLSEPKTPTKNSDFKLVFTVLDLTDSDSPISARCYYKDSLAGAWTQFDSDKAISAGGNTDSCQVNSSVVKENNKTYYFKVMATNGAASDDSELQGLVSVTFDDRDPSVPTNYKKEKIGSCQYKISFKTADDGMTTRVEVYRSDSTTMSLDGSTRVGDVTVSTNTDGSFTETVPDCNKTYYYVIRAFNVAGNASGPIGDSVTITTSTTSTQVQQTEGGAIPVANVTLPQGGQSGQVLGEEKSATVSPTQATEKGDIKGISTANKTKNFFEKNRYYILGLLTLAVVALLYASVKKKKVQKK